MIKMEIQSESEANICHYTDYANALLWPCHEPHHQSGIGSSKAKENIATHSLTLEQTRILKGKQQKNILNKIQKIVQKVAPIHEAQYQSDNQNDMHDLIEYFQKMDLE